MAQISTSFPYPCFLHLEKGAIRTISGARKSRLPQKVVILPGGEKSLFARPKSVRVIATGVVGRWRRMFSNYGQFSSSVGSRAFKSRWAMPWEWRYRTAWKI